MDAATLNRTFIPKDIIKRASLTNKNALLATNQFQKTGGNILIEFDPIQVKFNGYELNKPQNAIVKIINKSPIPQRVHVLPPSEPGFSIKVNKKGPIAAGMSENIQVTFTSDVHKYQYDVIKINSETGNFVIPLYAYPSIPKLQQIFPKIIDFGTVPINQNTSYTYPIENPVPMDFPFQFQYLEQSPAFIITPIEGIISAGSTCNVQIAFVPSSNRTFTAEVQLLVKQFDFQPIRIKILGTGREKRQGSVRRIKSSKLNPIVKEKEKDQKEVLESTIKALDATNQKKSFIRSKGSFPKLLNKTSNLMKVTASYANLNQTQKLETTFKKQKQREYIGQFSRVQELDKQKQIKFSQFLGDKAMNEQQLDFEQQVYNQTKKSQKQALKELCLNRFQSEKKTDGQIQISKVVAQNVTWDINKNDQLKVRKQKLLLFMQAGSKIIKKYRLLKRLSKIKQFLGESKTKQQVRKKVEQDYAKSLDLSRRGKMRSNQKFTFSLQTLAIRSYPMQFSEQNQSIKKKFQTEGKASFDDLGVMKQIQPHQVQKLNYTQIAFPNDYIYATRKIPSPRASAEQQYPLKTSSLPTFPFVQPSTVYSLPLKVPTHQFILNNFSQIRFKTSDPVDEKDPEYVIDSTVSHIEDEFEGWSKGDMDVLKAKFQRNMGCEFTGLSFGGYLQGGEVRFLHELGGHLPKEIGNLQITRDDTIQQGDSDEEGMNQIQPESADVLVNKIQQKSAKAKERRQKGIIQNFQGSLIQTIQNSLKNLKIKKVADPVGKVTQWNRWAVSKESRILL